MIRLLTRLAIFLGSAAIGLLAAALLVDGMAITPSGFVVTVIVFAVLQSLLAPAIAKVAHRHAKAFLGGVGVVSTFVSLLVAHVLTPGLTISGLGSWVAATVLVWAFTALAAFLLPVVTAKRAVEQRRGEQPGRQPTA